MNLGKTIQDLRKKKDLTQEQLAKKIDVSKKTISKWENDETYPDIEHLKKLCKIFKVDIENLVQGKISKSDKEEIDNEYKKFAKSIGTGVFLCAIGYAWYILLDYTLKNSAIPLTVLLIFILVGVCMFTYYGMNFEQFIKEQKNISKLYSKKEQKEFMKKFSLVITIGIGLIIFAIILHVALNNLVEEKLLNSLFVFLSSFSLFLFVKYGILASRFEYQKKAYEENLLVSQISSVVMLIATIIFLYLGFTKNLWHPTWVVFPIAGIICGILTKTIDKK